MIHRRETQRETEESSVKMEAHIKVIKPQVKGHQKLEEAKKDSPLELS